MALSTEKYTGLAQILKFPLLERAEKEMNYLDIARAKQDKINSEKEQKAKALYLGDYENFDKLKTFPKQDDNTREIYDNAYKKKLALLDKYPLSYLTEPPNTPEGKKFQAESREIDFNFHSDLNRQNKAIDDGLKLMEGMKKGLILADEDIYKFTQGGKNMHLTGVGFTQPSFFNTWSNMEKGLQATINTEVSTKTVVNGKEITDVNRKKRINVEETLKSINNYIDAGRGLYADSDNTLSPFDWYVAKNIVDKKKGYITLEDIHNKENQRKAIEQITRNVMTLRGITGTDIDALKPETEAKGLTINIGGQDKKLIVLHENNGEKNIGGQQITFNKYFYDFPSTTQTKTGGFIGSNMKNFNTSRQVAEDFPNISKIPALEYKIEAIVKNYEGLEDKSYNENQFFELGTMVIPSVNEKGKYIDEHGRTSREGKEYTTAQVTTPIIVRRPVAPTDFLNQGQALQLEGWKPFRKSGIGEREKQETLPPSSALAPVPTPIPTPTATTAPTPKPTTAPIAPGATATPPTAPGATKRSKNLSKYGTPDKPVRIR